MFPPYIRSSILSSQKNTAVGPESEVSEGRWVHLDATVSDRKAAVPSDSRFTKSPEITPKPAAPLTGTLMSVKPASHWLKGN